MSICRSLTIITSFLFSLSTLPSPDNCSGMTMGAIASWRS
jgi:hypothetical protein